MRKFLLFTILVLMGLSLFAQNPDAIKSDPGYLWAEGIAPTSREADAEALSALSRKIVSAVKFHSPQAKGKENAVIATYLSDLRRVSSSITSQGKVLRYLKRSDLGEVFSSRRKKVAEMISYSLSSSDKDVSGTYLQWARIYLLSLPDDNSSQLSEVERRLSALPSTSGTKVRLTNVEREIAGIRQALGLHEEVAASTDIEVARSDADNQGPTEEISIRRDTLSLEKPYDVNGVAVYGKESISLIPGSNIGKTFSSSGTEGKAQKESRLFAQVGASFLPELSFGALGAFVLDRWGGYVSFAGNFISASSSYECTSDGKTSDGYFWPSGAKRKSDVVFSVGPVYKLSGNFYLYAGGGYGRRILLWEDTSSQWVKVEDISSKGLSLEGGALFCYGMFSASVGLSSVGFSTLGVHLRAGISIPARKK